MKPINKALLAVVVATCALMLASTTVVNLATQVYGTLPCSLHPALTGDVTTSSCAATVAKNNGVPITVVTVLGTTGTVSMNFALGRLFTVTPTAAITLNATGCTSGAIATVIVTTSGTTSFTITPTTNFKGTALATGIVTAKTFGWSFVCNGTTAYQMGAATAAM